MLLAALISYWSVNTATEPKQVEAEEIISELEEFIKPILDFLSASSDEKLRAEFGSTIWFWRAAGIFLQALPDHKSSVR